MMSKLSHITSSAATPQGPLEVEAAGFSMRSLALSRVSSMASSKHSRLSSLQSSISLAASSVASLNRPEIVATTLSELYKKHGNISSAAHAYKKLVRQQTQDMMLAEDEEEDERSFTEASPEAIEETQALMLQLTKEVDRAAALAVRQISHLKEARQALEAMLAQLEMMTMLWLKKQRTAEHL